MCACGAIFDAEKVREVPTCPECGRPPDLWTEWGSDGVIMRD